MDDNTQFIFRIAGLLGFVSAFAVTLRIAYYSSNKIVWNIVWFTLVATVGKGVCFLLDVAVFPDQNNVFSSIYSNTFLYWLVGYLFIVGTIYKISSSVAEKTKLQVKTLKLIEESNQFIQEVQNG